MKFKGQYYDKDGNTQEAVVEADDRAGARAQIRDMGGIVSLDQVADHVNVTQAPALSVVADAPADEQIEDQEIEAQIEDQQISDDIERQEEG